MSENQKAFGKFPGYLPGEYFLIDVYTIEAIRQIQVPEEAIIFCESGKFYRSSVELDNLVEGATDAASNALIIIAQVATQAAGGGRFVGETESDDEDNFSGGPGQ